MPRKRADTNTCKNTDPAEQTGKSQSMSAAIPEASKRVDKQPVNCGTAIKQNGLSQVRENFYDGPAVRTRRKVNPTAYENRPSTSNGHEFYFDTDEESNKKKGKRKTAATAAAAKTSREKKKKKLNESDQVKEIVKEVIKEEHVNGNGVVAVEQKEQKEEKLTAAVQQQQQVVGKPQPQQQEQQQVQPEYTAAEQQLRMGDRLLSRELLSREKKKFIEIWLSGEGLHFAQMFDT